MVLILAEIGKVALIQINDDEVYREFTNQAKQDTVNAKN